MAKFQYREICPRVLITFTKFSPPELRIHIGTQVFVPSIDTQIYDPPHPSDPHETAGLTVTAFTGETSDDKEAEVRRLFGTVAESLFAVYSSDNTSRQAHPDLTVPDAYVLIVPCH